MYQCISLIALHTNDRIFAGAITECCLDKLNGLVLSLRPQAIQVSNVPLFQFFSLTRFSGNHQELAELELFGTGASAMPTSVVASSRKNQLNR